LRILRVIVILVFSLLISTSCSNEDISNSDTIESLKKIEEELSIDLAISESISPENSIEFDSIEEYERFIKDIIEQTTPVDEHLEFENSRNFNNPCSNLTGVFTGVAIDTVFQDLNYTAVISNGQITNFNGYFTGWTLGIDYESNGFTNTGNVVEGVGNSTDTF